MVRRTTNNLNSFGIFPRKAWESILSSWRIHRRETLINNLQSPVSGNQTDCVLVCRRHQAQNQLQYRLRIPTRNNLNASPVRNRLYESAVSGAEERSFGGMYRASELTRIEATRKFLLA